MIKQTVALILVLATCNNSFAFGVHSGVRGVYAGSSGYGTCAILADYQVSCWGDGYSSPQQPFSISGKRIAALAEGNGFACALLYDNTVWCWGNNSHGQLGNGKFSDHEDDPVQVSTIHDFKSISAGEAHVCAIRNLPPSGAAVWCWGSNSDGQLGNFNIEKGDDFNHPINVLVHDGMTNPALENVRRVAVGLHHSCAELYDDTLACWGDDYFGQLGNNADYSWFDSPQTVIVPSSVVSGAYEPFVISANTMSVGGDHTCAISLDSTSNAAACWGRNDDGQIGNGKSGTDSTGYQHSPTPEATIFPDGTKLRGLSLMYAAGRSTCAQLNDYTAACWGYGTEGQLGNGANDEQTSPYAVKNADGTTFGNFFQLTAGYSHFCAFTQDRLVYCWGNNALGQLGISDIVSANTPQKVALDATLFYGNFDEP